MQKFIFLYRTASGETKLSSTYVARTVQEAFDSAPAFLRANYITWFYDGDSPQF